MIPVLNMLRYGLTVELGVMFEKGFEAGDEDEKVGTDVEVTEPRPDCVSACSGRKPRAWLMLASVIPWIEFVVRPSALAWKFATWRDPKLWKDELDCALASLWATPATTSPSKAV